MTRPHAHSTSASQPYQPKPPRLLHRSPSEPVHVNGPLAGSNGVNGVNGENGALTSPSQQIYVLTADGSRLFLLDPTRPNGEEPPPYASFPIQHIPDSDADADAEADVEGNGYVGGIGDTLAPTSSRLLTPGYIPTSTSPIVEPSRRHRARTLSALSAERSRPRTSTTTSRPDNRRARTGLLTTTASPGPPYGRGVAVGPADERTPLLAVRVGDGMAEADEAVEGQGDGSLERRSGMRRGWWRGVCCGELEKGEQVGTWSDGWKRFWRPVGKKDYWASVFHLIFLNFPLVSFQVEQKNLWNVNSTSADPYSVRFIAIGIARVASSSRWYTCRHSITHHPAYWRCCLVDNTVHRSIGCAPRSTSVMSPCRTTRRDAKLDLYRQ